MPRGRTLALAVWLGAWALIHSLLSWQTAPPSGARSFNSPDEMANYFFAQRIAHGFPLAAPAPLGEIAGGMVHPRATAVYGGKLVPVSFVGLPWWYGMVGRLAGVAVLPYLTPVLAALAGLAFYHLVQVFFDRSTAWWSAVLLPLLPPWWYYAGRAMYHNVPFTALLLLGGWCLLRLRRHGYRRDALLAGVLLGLALAFRTVEAVWVVPLVVAVFISCARRHPSAWWLVVGVVAVWLPVLIQHQLTYGASWRFGYRLPPAEVIAVGAPAAPRWLDEFLPYGLHPRRAWGNAVRFSFRLLPWLALPALLGLATLLVRWGKLDRPRRAYLVALLAVAVILTLYYGSATLTDNLDPEATTLGISYVRYWLPLYVAVLPLAVEGGRWVAERWRSRNWRRATAAILLAAFGALSARLTTAEPSEGLAAVRRAIAAGYRKRQQVAARLPTDAVLVAERSDKLFFPMYPVVNTLLDDGVRRRLSELVAVRPVYYYTFLDDAGVSELQLQLERYGFQLSSPVTIAADAGVRPERLFTVSPRG